MQQRMGQGVRRLHRRTCARRPSSTSGCARCRSSSPGPFPRPVEGGSLLDKVPDAPSQGAAGAAPAPAAAVVGPAAPPAADPDAEIVTTAAGGARARGAAPAGPGPEPEKKPPPRRRPAAARPARGARGRLLRSASTTRVRAIPRGRVATYGQVARLLGVPARRARGGLGAAGAPRPGGDRVPWHRVVGAGGRISLRGRLGARDPAPAAARRGRALPGAGASTSRGTGCPSPVRPGCTARQAAASRGPAGRRSAAHGVLEGARVDRAAVALDRPRRLGLAGPRRSSVGSASTAAAETSSSISPQLAAQVVPVGPRRHRHAGRCTSRDLRRGGSKPPAAAAARASRSRERREQLLDLGQARTLVRGRRRPRRARGPPRPAPRPAAGRRRARSTSASALEGAVDAHEHGGQGHARLVPAAGQGEVARARGRGRARAGRGGAASMAST